MSAFPAWSTITTDEADRLLGLNTAERDALVKAGELRSLDYRDVMMEAVNDVCMAIRGALANNLALRQSLQNSGMYDIPQSMRSLAWPLIIRQLYLRYQINLTETRQKAAESADEMLARYARGERLPESVDGAAPADPAYMMPRFTQRPWFNPMRSTYR